MSEQITAQRLPDCMVRRAQADRGEVRTDDEDGNNGATEMQNDLGFRALVENSLDIVTVLDRDGTIRLESPSIKYCLGYRPEELEGRSAFEFVHEADRKRVLSYFRRSVQDARQNRKLTGLLQFRARHKDGTVRVFESVGRLIRDRQGQFCVLINSRDITARRVAEQALRESEARFRAVFEGSLDANLIFCANDWRATDVNEAFSRVYGYSAEEVLGRTPLEIGLWSRSDELEHFMRELSEGREVRAFDTVCYARDRTEIPSSITAVRLSLGSQMSVLAVIRDISRQKQAEAELAAARDAALEAARLKSAFLANTSHEIRTPLNVILGYTGLIEEHLALSGDDSQNAYLEAIERAGDRLLHTIEQVLDYSKIESGSFAVRPAPLRPAALINNVLRDLRELAAAKGISVEARIEAPDAVLVFDEHCLTGALMNLVQNAIRFTPATRCGRKSRVDLRLWRDWCGNLKLEIRDTGIGIDSRFLPHLLEPFSQEESSDKRQFEGWGLGLALTKGYLELNGATLSVASEKEVGSSFTISFASASEIHPPAVSALQARAGVPTQRLPRRKRPHAFGGRR